MNELQINRVLKGELVKDLDHESIGFILQKLVQNDIKQIQLIGRLKKELESVEVEEDYMTDDILAEVEAEDHRYGSD